MPITYPYLQYGGLWTASQQADAKAAGTWPVPPSPKLYSWGVNNQGQLALGNLTYYSSPKQVGALTTWSSLSAGVSTGYAIKSDGTLWAWGYNQNGQLGLNNQTNYSSPKQVGALTTWSQVSAGGYFVMAIKTDGTLWGWGYNGTGQLGINSAVAQVSSPVQVGSLTNWLKISANYNWCLAIKTDGTLWAWGSNQYGALGQNNTTYYSSPKQIGSGTTWANISSGSYATAFAIKTDGTIWGWGRGAQGQLGNGGISDYSSPKQIGALTNWSSVNSRPYSTLAIKTDGTLWSWGQNNYGQLGLGDTTNRSSPNQIGALTNWLFVSGAYGFTTMARKTDGTLWAWGRNDYGQCGQGTNSNNYSSPKQVGALTTWTNVASGNNHTLAIAITT